MTVDADRNRAEITSLDQFIARLRVARMLAHRTRRRVVEVHGKAEKDAALPDLSGKDNNRGQFREGERWAAAVVAAQFEGLFSEYLCETQYELADVLTIESWIARLYAARAEASRMHGTLASLSDQWHKQRETDLATHQPFNEGAAYIFGKYALLIDMYIAS